MSTPDRATSGMTEATTADATTAHATTAHAAPPHAAPPVGSATSSNPGAGTARPEPDKDATPEEIEADIERTRHEVGETVEALSRKLDVKSRARHQVDETKERVAERVEEAQHQVHEYSERARERLTDERGKPNRDGWIALAAAAAVVVLLIRSARR
ncbi:DUF3618 domain-containing protein [Zhihengliuella sp.]|uniref:DUF3618 domain-containing protein n=1 Tax=Zhihengliuella sp. TaxID=1954483 RepID=UPI002810C58A|nr:DUF3618 domain-containing protein [Zhihengliuella sp.]